MVEDTPDDLVHEIFTQTYWRGHALGRPILGTRHNVRSFDRKRLLNYFRRHYAPNNLLVSAAGHVQVTPSIVDLVQKEFGDLPAGPALRSGPKPVAHPHLQVRHKKDLEQVHLCVGAPSYPQPHKKRFPGLYPQFRVGRRHEFASVPEHSGKTRAGLRGILQPQQLSRCGLPERLCGTAADKARQVIDLVFRNFAS